jgi:hypothetical protein
MYFSDRRLFDRKLLWGRTSSIPISAPAFRIIWPADGCARCLPCETPESADTSKDVFYGSQVARWRIVSAATPHR